MNPETGGGPLDPAEREVEAALAGLVPAAVETGREEVVFRAGFEAGRREARGGVRAWRTTCCGLTGLAAALLVALLVRPGPRVQEHVVYVDRPAPAAAEQKGSSVVVKLPAAEPARRWSPEGDGGWLRMVWTAGDDTSGAPARIDPLARLQQLDAGGADATSIEAVPAGIREIRFRRSLGLSPQDLGGEAAYRLMIRGAAGPSPL